MRSVKGWIIWKWFYCAPVQNVQTRAKHLEHFYNFSTFDYSLVLDGFIVFALKLLIFFSFAGFCLRYCTILRLLFLLHDPTGSALLVLLCRPAAGGENHPGKGRGRRAYRKCPRSDLVGFQMLSSRHFSHSEKILWVHGVPSFLSHNHVIFFLAFLWEGCECVHSPAYHQITLRPETANDRTSRTLLRSHIQSNAAKVDWCQPTGEWACNQCSRLMM